MYVCVLCNLSKGKALIVHGLTTVLYIYFLLQSVFTDQNTIQALQGENPAMRLLENQKPQQRDYIKPRTEVGEPKIFLVTSAKLFRMV